MKNSRLLWKTAKDFEGVKGFRDYERIITWLQNFIVNRDTIGFNIPVSDLDRIRGSALIIDKSMMSTKFFEFLSAIKDYKGTIICCDRAIYEVIKHKVPNYVCNLDASPLCMSFFDRPDVKAVMPKITAVFSTTTNPLTIRLWHGTRAFFTPGFINDEITKELMMESNTPNMETGGQVACFAWILACNLGADPIGIYGVAHGYDEIEETEFPMAGHKKRKGPHGFVLQDPLYEWYNNIYLELIDEAKFQTGITTINTSQAGLLYNKNVVDMPLEEFVKKYE